VLGDLVDCPPGPAGGAGDPDLPPLTGDRVTAVLTWARAQAGEAYVFGASGPDAWDCSSFVQAAFARIGVTTPRTAAAQRDWLAAGNGHRVPLGQERPGDLVFWDSYRGPHAIGHVAIVWDPAQQTTVEARSTRAGVGHFSYADCPTHAICEVWRVANITDHPHHTANSAASLAVNAAAARDTDPGDPDPPTGVGGGA
jgi:cell wall-associated NlpC family hydrolase